jgi:OOP family OmpA-OmpF porin
VADARTRWLGGQIDEAAKTAKKKEDLADLVDQIAKTAADLGQVSAAALDLTHEKARLERVGALLKAPYERTLPGGFRIKAASSGIEARLIDFIQGPKKVDNATWFDFDRLQFFPEGADIDFRNSRDQLQNVVEILKAYPTVKLKVGGYTDSGPSARNKKLSTDRAEAVRTALIQMGVPPARLEAHGYGADRPVCPANDTEFCRAQNRRIAVQVTAIRR